MRLCRSVLSFLCSFLVATALSAQPKAVAISGVTVDEGLHRLVIEGREFIGTSTIAVTLGGIALALDGAHPPTPQRIVAVLPALPPGTYPLVVSNGNGTVNTATIYLTLGAAGPTGPAGAMGPAGAPGATGPIGPVGPAGAEGPPGPDGLAGPEGPAGPIGPAGAAGPPGPVGMVGATGDAGIAGETGPQGIRGPTGPPGIAGPSGAAGVEGPTGPQGPAGPIGPTGATGLAGAQGPAGLAGAAGPQGMAGGAGATGPKGPVGSAGPTGAAGAAGPTGSQGVPGAVGPVGFRGPTSAAGPTGPQGPAGPAGTLGWHYFYGAYNSRQAGPQHQRTVAEAACGTAITPALQFGPVPYGAKWLTGIFVWSSSDAVGIVAPACVGVHLLPDGPNALRLGIGDVVHEGENILTAWAPNKQLVACPQGWYVSNVEVKTAMSYQHEIIKSIAVVCYDPLRPGPENSWFMSGFVGGSLPTYRNYGVGCSSGPATGITAAGDTPYGFASIGLRCQ